MPAVTTTTNIIDFFEQLIDEDVDADLAIRLANHAKDLIEGDRPWRFLITEDSSKTRTPSDTYLTAKLLPTNPAYVESYKVFLGDATLNDFFEIFSIPYELRRKVNDKEVKYYIDPSGENMYITGTVDKTYTIYHYYIKQTPTLDTTSENPVWPARFRVLISYIMAEIYQLGVDVDDITVKQAIEHNKQAKMVLDSMIDWDTRMKLKSMNNQTNVADQMLDIHSDGRIMR